jgi:hypothetical protein
MKPITSIFNYFLATDLLSDSEIEDLELSTGDMDVGMVKLEAFIYACDQEGFTLPAKVRAAAGDENRPIYVQMTA